MKHEEDTYTRPDARGIEEALSLFPLGLELTRARLRREDPEASPEVIEERLTAWLHESDHATGQPNGDGTV
jgi:hypothetical protein